VELGRIMKYHSIPLGCGAGEAMKKNKSWTSSAEADHVLRASFRSMSLEVYSEDHKFKKKTVLIARNCVRRWLGLG